MNSIITWDESLSTGIAEFDCQLKWIVKYLNSLIMTSDYGTDSSFMSSLPELHEFLIAHSENEEILMKEIAYPGLDSHKHEHRFLLTAFDEIIQRLNSREKYSNQSAVAFMVDWFNNHIYKSDRELAAHLISVGFTNEQYKHLLSCGEESDN